jgi:hypothetical protein
MVDCLSKKLPTFADEDLCDICRDVDFFGMFSDTDDEHDSYRADDESKKQVRRTWQHISKHQQRCSFCRLTYQQLQHYISTLSETTADFQEPPKISIIQVTSACVSSIKHEFPKHIGFYNGTYYGWYGLHGGLEHKRLLIRGLQLSAICTSGLEERWLKWIQLGTEGSSESIENLS